MRSLSVALLLLLGCTAGPARKTQRPGGPQEALRRLAEAERAVGERPADVQARARAGWLRYLVKSDPDGALALLAGAGSRDGAPSVRAGTGAAPGAAAANPAGALPGDAASLCAIGEIREDRLDTLGAAQAWARAVEVEPLGPWAELAAIRLLDAQGDSRAIDDVVVQAAQLRTSARAARILREAAARVFASRGDPDGERRLWSEAGAIQRWRVGGPYGTLRLFELGRALALDGPVRARAQATCERELDFPDGDVGLDQEPGDGDLFYAASDVTVARGGDYLLWVEGAGAVELRIDGEVRIARVPYPRESVRSQTAAVKLAPGRHEVLARWSRVEGPRFRVVLARGDGAASDSSSVAPAQLEGHRGEAPCALGRACVAKPAWNDASDLRVFAARLLDEDDGDPLGAWLAARVALGDDRPAARTFAGRAVALSSSGAPALALRAQQTLHDPEVPERIGRARALADLTEALARDPKLLRARLSVAAIDRDSERFDDAAAELDKADAEAARDPAAVPPARLLLSRARLLESRGNLAAARARAEKAGPGRCDAIQLLFDLARREGGVAEQARLAAALEECPEGLATAAFVARDRGDPARAELLLERAARLRPALVSRLEALAEVQAARKEKEKALETMRRAAALAPRTPEPLRRLAGMAEALGLPDEARRAREAALRLAPGDLQLRQQLALDAKKPLMPWSDRDALALLKTAPKTLPGASAVRILDAGAVQMFDDGGGVERVHTIARVLDKKGIGRFGEAQIPADAQLLHLRTLKSDGRILEPESIPEKEGVSLPGLEAGDAVEIDYLRPVAPRGKDLPGYTLGAFFFRDDETPMVESTYEVRAPASVGLEVDAHGIEKSAPRSEGGELRYSHTARDVTPHPPEPHQPSENETMPWVQLGAGGTQKDLVLSIADWALLRTRASASTEELARASAGKTPRETAAKLHHAIAAAVRGRSTGTDFSAPAGHVLAQGRGNRLVVLKAALAAAGIGSHVVLVRTFGVDPADYRFPRGDLYGYAVLRVDLPEGAVWIDPAYRLAPFGQLPAFVRGQDGWVVPEPGEAPVRVQLPASLPEGKDGRVISIEVALSPDGSAQGTGRDEHRGFEAAGLKDALERMDSDQRKQAVEAMLGRGLRGVALEKLSAEHEGDVGGTATLVYSLRAQIARKDSAQLFAPATLLPARLVRRWASKADRTTALLVDAPEDETVHAVLALPAALHLRDAPAAVALDTPFGSFHWSAREEGGRLVLDESLRIPQQRIAPAQYAEFVAFAKAVDEAQGQELRLAP